MLKSCKYCGRIHDSKILCKQKKIEEDKRKAKRKNTKAYKFRKTKVWERKSRQIRQDDNYLCLCCLDKKPGTIEQYNSKEISVHHIDPIEEDYGKRLDDDNLITVCPVHHEMCEKEEITREEQRDLITRYRRQQEDTVLVL